MAFSIYMQWIGVSREGLHVLCRAKSWFYETFSNSTRDTQKMSLYIILI